MILDKNANEDDILFLGTFQELNDLLKNPNTFSKEESNELKAVMQIMKDFPSESIIKYYEKNGYHDSKGIDASIEFGDNTFKIQITNTYKDKKKHGAKENWKQKWLTNSKKEQEEADDLISDVTSYCEERYNAQQSGVRNNSNKIQKIKHEISILKTFRVLEIKEDFLEECYNSFLEEFVLPSSQIKFIFDRAMVKRRIQEKLHSTIRSTIFYGSAANRYLNWTKTALNNKMHACSKNHIDILLLIVPDDTILITTLLEDEALSLSNNFQSLCEEYQKNYPERIYPKTVYCVFPRTALPFLKWSSNYNPEELRSKA